MDTGAMMSLRTIRKGCNLNMKKNIIKIILDVIMTVILVLLFNSHVFAMTFHEVAGLFIGSLFVIHCLLNKKWIAAITTKFFSKSLAPRIRFGYIIDLLLVISFLFIIISGIRTSQVLFPMLADGKDSPWRNVHHFFAAVSIILVGIHLGLHWDFVSNMFKKMLRIPQKVSKPLSIALLTAALAFGVYSIATSSFTGWLTAPFTSAVKSESNTDEKGSIPDSDTHTPKKGEHKGNGNSGTKTDESKQGALNNSGNLESQALKASQVVFVSTLAATGKDEAGTDAKENSSGSSEHIPKSGENKNGSNPATPTPTPTTQSEVQQENNGKAAEAPVNNSAASAGDTDIKNENNGGAKENSTNNVTNIPKSGENKTGSGAAVTTPELNESGKTQENSQSADVSKNDTEIKSENADGAKESATALSDNTPKSGENKDGNSSDPAAPKAEESKQGSSDQTGHTEMKEPEGSPAVILNTIATFISIIGVFAAATYYLDKLLARRKKRLQ